MIASGCGIHTRKRPSILQKQKRKRIRNHLKAVVESRTKNTHRLSKNHIQMIVIDVLMQTLLSATRDFTLFFGTMI